MQRLIRIIAIVVLLGTVLSSSFFIYHQTAHACGQYMLSGSQTDVLDVNDGNNGINFYLELWYNSCTDHNYAYLNIYAGNASKIIILYVERADGPDGPSARGTNFGCPSAGICTSPGVYAVSNLAKACFQDPFIVVCTDLF